MLLMFCNLFFHLAPALKTFVSTALYSLEFFLESAVIIIYRIFFICNFKVTILNLALLNDICDNNLHNII
jgi:hypothetical protein